MKIQIKSLFGSLLFEADYKENTILKTLLKAIKKGANLQGAYLQGADLQGANLQGADLRSAYLRSAYLQYADLQGANLQGAYLQGAYLQCANLQGANLQGADLRSAYLRSAYLQYADLQGADLRGANLQGAYLRGANNYYLQCPEVGSFIGWKKCINDVIVKLQIPEDAQRSSATSGKCRCSKAIVLEVIGADFGISQNDSSFLYKVGEIVESDKFDTDRFNECSNGIHFFITRQEAENY
jgi:uncharacterized protein YjbI with pentapeptide repeats